MTETLTLTDSNYEDILNNGKPALLLLTNGEGLRSEFSVAYKKAAAEETTVTFATIDPTKNTQAAEFFKAGSKPVLIGWYDGQEMVRRPRPWGSDVPLALEMLKNAYTENNPEPKEETSIMEPTTENTEITFDDKPVAVTDADFQKEVIDYPLPVVVDFWAEWCGPCRMVAPILDKLAQEFAGKIRIAKVDVDANPGLSQTFRIQSIPTIMMFKERNIVFSQPGALPEPALRDIFQQLIDLEIPEQEEEETSEES